MRRDTGGQRCQVPRPPGRAGRQQPLLPRPIHERDERVEGAGSAFERPRVGRHGADPRLHVHKDTAAELGQRILAVHPRRPTRADQ